MLCPICGKEYEGKECPNCSKPKILVNENDYLMRKMAYEKKQAGDRSAFLATPSSKENDITEDMLEQLKNGKLKGVEFISGKKALLKDKLKRNNKRVKNKNNTGLDGKEQDELIDDNEASKENKPLTLKFRKRKNLKPRICIIVICAVLAILAGVGIYRLAVRKNYSLYIVSNDKIYNISGLENKMVCEAGDAVFDPDGVSFFIPKLPDEIKGKNINDKLASYNGKYYAASIFNEETGSYSLYIWNSSNCVKVVENNKAKAIKYVDDRGQVIFGDYNIINEEGAISDLDYYIYSLQDSSVDSKGAGKLIKLGENIKSIKLYNSKNKIITLDGQGKLDIFDYKEFEKKNIDAGISTVLYQKQGQYGVYTADNEFVNSEAKASGICYSNGAHSYYYNFLEDSLIELNRAILSDTIIYLSKANDLYMLTAGKLSYSEIADDKANKYKDLDNVKRSDMLFDYSTGQMIYVNDQGSLRVINKGEMKECNDSIDEGTLIKVENSDNAFAFRKNGVYYYTTDISSKLIKMTDKVVNDSEGEASDNGNILTKVIQYKNIIYFCDTNGVLGSCTTKGKDSRTVGNVEQVWLGRELK